MDAARAWDSIDTEFKPWKIDPEVVRGLSRVSGMRSACHIAFEWTLVFAAIALCQHYRNLFVYVLTVMFIGARQHSLLILMHDGTHHRLFKNRRVNDCVSAVLCSWPMFLSFVSFRRNHMLHHANVNTARDPDVLRKQNDPDWDFPIGVVHLIWLLLKQVTGFGLGYIIMVLRSLEQADSGPVKEKWESRGRLIFYAAALGLIFYFGVFRIFLLCWVVPFATWLILLFRVRSIAEHPVIERASRYETILDYKLNLFDRIFFVSKNVQYHIEHHAYPSVPFFNLPKLHKAMMRNESFRKALRPVSYIGLLRMCVEEPAPARQLEPT